MPNVYLDHDVHDVVVDLLGAEGHAVTTTRQLGLTAAPDYRQLLTAAQRGAIMVTHNHKDFVELHGAWLTWSHEWAVSSRHFGIVIVPQRASGELWTADIIAGRLLELLGQGLPSLNELYRWRTGAWVLQQP